MESIEVSIFGRKYPILSDKNPDELHALASEVDKMMRNLSEKLPDATTTSLAVLACLNFLDEIKLESDNLKNQKSELKSQINLLIKDIDAKLSNS